MQAFVAAAGREGKEREENADGPGGLVSATAVSGLAARFTHAQHEGDSDACAAVCQQRRRLPRRPPVRPLSRAPRALHRARHLRSLRALRWTPVPSRAAAFGLPRAPPAPAQRRRGPQMAPLPPGRPARAARARLLARLRPRLPRRWRPAGPMRHLGAGMRCWLARQARHLRRLLPKAQLRLPAAPRRRPWRLRIRSPHKTRSCPQRGQWRRASQGARSRLRAASSKSMRFGHAQGAWTTGLWLHVIESSVACEGEHEGGAQSLLQHGKSDRVLHVMSWQAEKDNRGTFISVHALGICGICTWTPVGRGVWRPHSVGRQNIVMQQCKGDVEGRVVRTLRYTQSMLNKGTLQESVSRQAGFKNIQNLLVHIHGQRAVCAAGRRPFRLRAIDTASHFRIPIQALARTNSAILHAQSDSLHEVIQAHRSW